LLSSPNRGIPTALNGIYLIHRQICGMLSEPLRPHAKTGLINRKVVRLNEA